VRDIQQATAEQQQQRAAIYGSGFCIAGGTITAYFYKVAASVTAVILSTF
jgi:hypothetical protein